MISETRRLTKREVPDGSLIAVLSDVHVPNHDEDVCKLVVECCERVGVTHVILNGDIADCGPASRHPGKQKRAVLDEGCLRESVAAGLWVFDWARTRPCWYILGNHEAWVEDYIKQSPELKGTTTTSLLGLWDDGDGWEVMPNRSRLTLGNQTWEHGNAIFPTGAGGENPAGRIKKKVPDRSSSIGHLHQKFAHYWTTPDEDGIPRTRCARGNGHLSIAESHEDYAAYASWQQSFELTEVYYVDGRPRFTVSQPEIFRDRHNRPFFKHEGHLYR